MVETNLESSIKTLNLVNCLINGIERTIKLKGAIEIIYNTGFLSLSISDFFSLSISDSYLSLRVLIYC